MVNFTHIEGGTRERHWEQAAGWERVGPIALSGVQRLLVVAAHPDDEALGVGGFIATAVARGLRVTIVMATDGESSHPDSRTHTPARLAKVRRGEAREAARVLGVRAQPRHLGLPDGALAEHETALRIALEEILAQLGSEGTLVAAPWRSDGHPDHEAAGRAARVAAESVGARFVEYPVWLWHWAEPDAAVVPWSRMAKLELSSRAQYRKHRALLAHRSQIAPLSEESGDETLLGQGFRSHFERPYEVLIEERADEQARDGTGASLDTAFFDEFYADNQDPWGYETRWYEERKRALTLAALPRPRFRRALELGCSIGVLTAELATRCDAVVGVDIAEAPLRAARDRLGERDGVELRQMRLPSEWPDGAFDLVVLSEVGYYWDRAGLALGIERCVASMATDGVLVACHWRHPVEEYPLDGDTVHAQLGQVTGIVRTVQHIEEDFILEVFARPPAASVARETGLV